MLLFWSFVTLSCISYFPVGWLFVRIGWLDYATYDSFKLGVVIFAVLSAITVWVLAVLAYELFYEFWLVQFIFPFGWAAVGELFSGKVSLEWYWYVPFFLYLVNGVLGVFVHLKWSKDPTNIS
jgi:hypothetical protein